MMPAIRRQSQRVYNGCNLESPCHWKVADIWSGGQYGSPEGSLLTCGVVVALMVYLVKAPIFSQPLALAAPTPEERS